ncbi:MAG: 50S ribosomal protein L7/L12 [Planctomycetes bacterium]|nr:50S ribosomal protein L7/L12 [Planctomycetota bacterium]
MTEATEVSEKKEVEITKEQQEILEKISTWNLLDLSNFIKAFEEKFDVTAAAPAMMTAAAGAGAAEEEEKTLFDVVLKDFGDKKIQVIKVVRQITSLGLKEAKDLVESAPKAVKEALPKDEAAKIKEDLEAVGATVTIE